MIARALEITDGTVKLHVKAILRKLGHALAHRADGAGDQRGHPSAGGGRIHRGAEGVAMVEEVQGHGDGDADASSTSTPLTRWPTAVRHEQGLADDPGPALAPPDAAGQQEQAQAAEGDEGVGRLGHGEGDHPEQERQPASAGW